MARRTLLVVLVVCTLALASCTYESGHPSVSSASSPPSIESRPPSSSVIPSTGRSPASREIRPVLSLPGPVTALTAGADGVLYAAFLPHPEGDREVIVRFDPVTGAVARSEPIAGGQGGVHRVAYAGDSLWVTGGTSSRRGSRRLYRLDGTTLSERDVLRMPAPPTALSAVPAGLWVAAGKELTLLDPWSGAVLRDVSFRGRIQLLVAAPSGRSLYVVTDKPVHRNAIPLLELSAETGATIRTSWQGYADLNGPSGLAPTDNGVWITQPTGMMATLSFLRASDLHLTALFKPGGSNGLTDYVVAGVLFVAGSPGGYYCADASNGRVLGRVGIGGTASGTSDIVAVPSGLYVGGWKALDKIVPEPACGSG